MPNCLQINALQNSSPELKLVDSHASPDTNTIHATYEGLKPDISVYRRECPRTRPTDFSLMEFYCEAKFDPLDDPFGDITTLERKTNAAKDTKGQITSYAVAQRSTQFRTHIFSILLFPKFARLIRWDQAGAVVTKGFPLEHLVDFVKRYNDASPLERGVDDTVSTPSEELAEIARKELGLPSSQRMIQFNLPASADISAAQYIGAEPVYKPNSSPTGRATCAFIVYDVQRAKLVFLKDTWRIDLPSIEKEGDIYRHLHQCGVSHIAPLVRAEDITHQRTLTQDYADESGKQPFERKFRPHQHYLLILDVVAQKLFTFRSAWELVIVMRDALIGILSEASPKHLLT